MTPSKKRTLQILSRMTAEEHYQNYAQLALVTRALHTALFGAIASGTASALLGVANSRGWAPEISSSLGVVALAAAFYTLSMVAFLVFSKKVS